MFFTFGASGCAPDDEQSFSLAAITLYSRLFGDVERRMRGETIKIAPRNIRRADLLAARGE